MESVQSLTPSFDCWAEGHLSTRRDQASHCASQARLYQHALQQDGHTSTALPMLTAAELTLAAADPVQWPPPSPADSGLIDTSDASLEQQQQQERGVRDQAAARDASSRDIGFKRLLAKETQFANSEM